jgi:hypothetical protein
VTGINKGNQTMSIHQLQVGEMILLKIEAADRYSTDTLQVGENEHYHFFCTHGQTWKDWFYYSGPDGYFNPLAWLLGLRVKGVRCFCLCGTMNEEDKNAFSIGPLFTFKAQSSGELSFFANDVSWCYFNNSGDMNVQITRKR